MNAEEINLSHSRFSIAVLVRIVKRLLFQRRKAYKDEQNLNAIWYTSRQNAGIMLCLCYEFIVLAEAI